MAALRIVILGLIPIAAAALTSTTDNVTLETPTLTTTQYTNNVDGSDWRIRFRRVQMILASYGNGCIGILAIIFNSFNLRLFGIQKSLSPYIYLTWIAACDLIAGIFLFWNVVTVNQDFVCTFPNVRPLSFWTQLPSYFLRTTFGTSSSYLVVALGFDRLIAVRYPMKRALWCTKRKAHIISLVLVIAGAIPNIHILFRIEPITPFL
jgi:hypothetical protein